MMSKKIKENKPKVKNCIYTTDLLREPFPYFISIT